jgi:integrase
MATKTTVKPEEELIPLLQSIQPPKLQTYAALLYWLACRAGELLPYTHYKTTYKKNLETKKLVKDINGNFIIEKREKVFETPGIPVSTIKVMDEWIEFTSIPVFKSKENNKTKTGFVPKKNNPLFQTILKYVAERKAIQTIEYEKTKENGSLIRTVYLFERELAGETNQQFFWRFKKALERYMNYSGYTIHSLRKTRATKAGNISGDPYYVQSITGHASISMASEYVQSKKLFDSMKRYEGF